MSDDTALDFTPEPFDPRKTRVVRETARAERAPDPTREEWRPAAQLPEPDPEVGYSFRWVRNGVGNMSDSKNVAKKFAEGWEPVLAASQPRMAKLLGRHGVNTEGNIEIGGLILCKMPTERVNARNRYYSQMSRDQQAAVDNAYMRDNSRKVVKLAPERYTTTSNSAT